MKPRKKLPKRETEKEQSKEEKKEEPQLRYEPHKFTAYVSGPVFAYEVSGRDMDEAYEAGVRILKHELEKYQGKVKVEKIEVERYSDISW